MEQTKALDALAPFVALSKSATSPRAAADVVTRATSAPNTYLFAELLQATKIQALARSPEYGAHLELLRVFSYGTFQTYRANPDLPALSDAQALKLRQLSLLTLARDRANLSYDALQRALHLASPRELEDLVVKAVYAGLLHATLDPARQAVQVTSIAPLRDLRPGSVPDMMLALNAWAGRCTATLADIEAQAAHVRSAAAARAADARAADEKLLQLMVEVREEKTELPTRDGLAARRGINKRSMLDSGGQAAQESMELDDPNPPEEQTKRASKRKM